MTSLVRVHVTKETDWGRLRDKYAPCVEVLRQPSDKSVVLLFERANDGNAQRLAKKLQNKSGVRSVSVS